MTRYDLYTALIGISSVFFSLTVFTGAFPTAIKIPLVILGVIVFVHSAYTLYRSLTDKDFLSYQSARANPKSNTINAISLLNKNGERKKYATYSY